MATRTVIDYARAERIVSAIVERCTKDAKRPVAVAVVDDRGDLVAFGCMDGVSPRARRLALDKAYTAALQESSTKDFVEWMARTNRQVTAFADPRYVALAGGVPVTSDGRVLGAVGVSGRSAEEDHDLAAASL